MNAVASIVFLVDYLPAKQELDILYQDSYPLVEGWRHRQKQIHHQVVEIKRHLFYLARNSFDEDNSSCLFSSPKDEGFPVLGFTYMHLLWPLDTGVW